MKAEPILVLFAKKPVAGKVKTRLSPPLTDKETKQLAMTLIEESVRNACEYWPGPVELCLWPDKNDAFIEALTDRYQFALTVQSQGNLGDKMVTTMTAKTRLNQVALIMGCDVPHCSKEIQQEAFNKLQECSNVIGPTIDGGYYCIGVNQPDTRMFKNVDWGTDRALKQTLASCRSCGIEFDSNLPELRDLDDYEDLLVLSGQCPILEPFLI